MLESTLHRILTATSCLAALWACASPAQAQEKLHFTYLWHMEQPIYWPDQQVGAPDRYERAWQSILRKDAGAQHPENDLREIFSKADRVAAYQWRVRDAVQLISGYPEAGVQVSYSGSLIENLQSIGAVSQLGYSPSWNQPLRQASAWTTQGQGASRADIVMFPFHHPLSPLVADSTLRKELELYQAAYGPTWGSAASRGFFPPEMAFSTRMIPALAEAGIEWAFVSGEKLSRACADFPVVYGSGGINCDPPNLADQLNPAQGDYYRRTISRGCSPAEAYPFGFTPHRARHVDPATGEVHELIVVPCSQSLGWDDGYAAIGVDPFHELQVNNDPERPQLVVLAHDGDNNWGGGYTYYMEATPGLVNQAQAAGFHATVVQEYLQDHPVPAGDLAHVEDGAWVNADGDFGAPQMLNWNWPPVSGGQVDIAGGWAEDIRNWAVITAAQNHVDTAEQIWTDQGGSVLATRILDPSGASNAVERAWHFFMGSLNSGYMYYGTALDMEVKPAVACNEALEHTALVIGDGSEDRTPPTVWIPQRHPWNPGSSNFGPQYGYQEFIDDGDFEIWTFAHDLSGIESVTLRYRVDLDGVRSLTSTENETYAGGAGVGSWQSLPMTFRDFPAGNVNGDGSIDFFEMPDEIADQYHVEVKDLREVLLDYYVEAVDSQGNQSRSPIQHVWVGDGSGSGGGGADAVRVLPDPPQAGQPVEVRHDPTGRPLAGAAQVLLHYGFDDWSNTPGPDLPMTFDVSTGEWFVSVDVPADAVQFDMVFTDGQGTWDNNAGQDWHFPVEGGEPADEWIMDGQLDADAVLVGSTGGASLWAGVKEGKLYVATESASGSDRFLLVADTPGPMQPAMWAKAGLVAGWDAFLADEADNGYFSWFDAAGETQAAQGSVLEGTLDLAGQFGSVPDEVHLALTLYATTDGGALDAARQVAASVNGDGNVDPAEYAGFDPGTGGGCSIEAYCAATPNSTGSPAGLTTSGSASVGANDLVLEVRDVPAGQFGIFFYGPQESSTPFGNGILCVNPGGVGLFRLTPPVTADATGLATRALDVTDPPEASGQIESGSTWSFQFWYRDPGGGGSFFNLSDALRITFCP